MRWPLPCATPTRALVPCPTCSRAAPTPRASPGWASAASGSPRCGYRPNWTSRRCSMASTNGYRSTDYSSACECSTGSCRAAERPRFPGGEDMTDRHAELDAALDRVMAAAREHLAAVKAADGRTDDDEVWRAYVELNNASFEYDEVTPWDVEAIDPDEADRAFGVGVDEEPTDPYPRVVSVRQRRDYRVPSVAALLRVAEAARRAAQQAEHEPVPPVESVGEAVLELMQASDGSMGALDIPELESLNGVVVVAEVAGGLDPEAYDDADATGPFAMNGADRVLDRLDEHAYVDDEAAEESTSTAGSGANTAGSGANTAGSGANTAGSGANTAEDASSGR